MEVVAKKPRTNATKMVGMMREAKENGATMAVFGEMAVPGYMVGDLWEDASFIKECLHQIEYLKKKAKEIDISVIFGNVEQDPTDEYSVYEDGRSEKFNSALHLWHDGSTLDRYSKVNRPNYREFDDKRYFQKGRNIYQMRPNYGYDWSLSICEDGWDDDYPDKPIQRQRRGLRNILVNLSCSPYTKGKNGARNKRFAKHSEEFTALFYVNCVGIQNNGKGVFVFDGSTTVYNQGQQKGALPPLQECIGYLDVVDETVTLAGGPWMATQKDPELKDVLVYGTKKFLEQSGMSKAVIGLSGGIDSALSAMIHVKALGPENVVLVNMPTQYNSGTTKGIAAEIAKNLGCPYIVVPIGDLCSRLEDAVGNGLYSGAGTGALGYRVDAENIAARMRGAGIQAALAAGLGAVFPNNGNKSEVTVGYTTMYGDHAGYLAPIADLWKTEVYDVSKELSAEMGGILPDSIFTLKPSAELSDKQDVEKGLGDPMSYWYHDRLFASWMEPWQRYGIEKTFQDYLDGTLLKNLGLEGKEAEFNALFPTATDFISDAERWWGLFVKSAFKRVQAPPVLVVSRRSYGFDFREAIGTGEQSKEAKDLRRKILSKDADNGQQ
jgi:NAD+ synthase (glutamine-hydrolysing)